MKVAVAYHFFPHYRAGVLRELLGFFVDHATAVYLSYLILGGVLMIAGFVALHMRHRGEGTPA